jgi:large subunit ribosomal protein L25
MAIELNVQTRNVQGTGASRRLRHAGKVPGIIYGGGIDPVTIQIDHTPIFYALKNETFHASVISLIVDGKAEPVLLRDVHYHPWKPQVQHIDFQRVSANEKITMKVPLHFINADTCPAVKLSGANINHVLNDVEIACLPAALPEFLTVDLAQLQAGKTVHLSDITLPAGVEITSLVRGEDLAVVTAVAAKG